MRLVTWNERLFRTFRGFLLDMPSRSLICIRGLIAVQNPTDDKNYEIHFAPSAVTNRNELGVGRDVPVRATFEGTRYIAQSDPTKTPEEDK